MTHLAYDKDTHKILAFINTEDEINPLEVFDGFENYEVKKTNITPPFKSYTKYIVLFDENGEISGYKKVTEIESDNQ